MNTLMRIPMEFEIFETLLFDPTRGEFALLEAHVHRIEASCHELGFPFSRSSFLGALDQAVQGQAHRLRVRAALSRDGIINVHTTSLPAEGVSSSERQATILEATDVLNPVIDLRFVLDAQARPTVLPTIDISNKRTNSEDPLLFHKTTKRGLYDEEYQRLTRANGCFEVIFLNEKGELTEGSRTNLMIKSQDQSQSQWLTPPVRAGLLNGVFRQALLSRRDFQIQEETLTLDDLRAAERIFVMNSVRGLVEVALLNDNLSHGGQK